jgi:hypothetical protein
MTENQKLYDEEHRHYNFIRMWQRRYNHMKYRNLGITTNRSHAAGKDILTKEEFMEWCKAKHNLVQFIVMYLDWVSSGFELGLCPSIDRIDPDIGYTRENIQWMTFSDNCAKNHKYIDHRGIMVRERV